MSRSSTNRRKPLPAPYLLATPPVSSRLVPSRLDRRQSGCQGTQTSFTSERRRSAQLDLISTFISDSYFGQLWWNAAVIMVAILCTYFATRLGGGIASLLVIGAFCATYYNTSMTRTVNELEMTSLARWQRRRWSPSTSLPIGSITFSLVSGLSTNLFFRLPSLALSTRSLSRIAHLSSTRFA